MGLDGYLRPVQFLDHLTVIIIPNILYIFWIKIVQTIVYPIRSAQNGTSVIVYEDKLKLRNPFNVCLNTKNKWR